MNNKEAIARNKALLSQIEPEPNEHGVYSHDHPAVERLVYESRKAKAAIYVLQLPTGDWIASMDFTHRQGNYHSECHPLSPSRKSANYISRTSAIQDQAQRIRSANMDLACRADTPKAQCAEARAIVIWADRILRELW